MEKGSHNFVHPQLAVENASTITELSDLEKDIILKHMFLCTTTGLPRYKESFVVTCVDKYCAISEVANPTREKVKAKVSNWMFKLLAIA